MKKQQRRNEVIKRVLVILLCSALVLSTMSVLVAGAAQRQTARRALREAQMQTEQPE